MSSRVVSFEDLIAWQKARSLNGRIYEITRHASFREDFCLRNQMRSASNSTMANVAEGHERCSPKDFARFLKYAKGSNAELRSHLYAAFDAHFITQEEFNTLLPLASEVSRIIGGLLASIKRQIVSDPD